jgi:hypothetical protein
MQEVFELVEKVLFMLHQQHQALHADNKQGINLLPNPDPDPRLC